MTEALGLPLWAARALRWLAGGSVVGLIALAAGAVVALAAAAIVVRFVRARTGTRGLRRMGYAPEHGTAAFVRSVDRVRVAFEPRTRRFVARMAAYAPADFVAEPRLGPGGAEEPGPDVFLSEDVALDTAFTLWSERKPFARDLVRVDAVRHALLDLSDAAIAVRGDELVVELPRVRPAHHDRVVRLARAIVR